jgi:hypothetical protein
LGGEEIGRSVPLPFAKGEERSTRAGTLDEGGPFDSDVSTGISFDT